MFQIFKIHRTLLKWNNRYRCHQTNSHCWRQQCYRFLGKTYARHAAPNDVTTLARRKKYASSKMHLSNLQLRKMHQHWREGRSICQARHQCKSCSHKGCTNNAQVVGVWAKHGSKVKNCSHDECTNIDQKQGVCMEYYPLIKTCSHERYTSNNIKGGVRNKHSIYCSFGVN